MKVSRRSWHYRLYRYTKSLEDGKGFVNPLAKGRRDVDVPKSLCPYAWSIFLGLVGALVVVVVLGVAYAVAGPFYLVGLVIVRAFRAVWSALGWILEVSPKVGVRRSDRPEKKKRPPRERRPSIVVAIAKSQKERVCPMIELVD